MLRPGGCEEMKVRWDADAEKVLQRVPFFVRHRVRKKVEEDVAAAGRTRVTAADLEESKKRQLQRLSEGVKGYTLETCFGGSGCQNAVVVSADLVSRLDELLERADFLSFLRNHLGEKLKLHHQFRVTLADCPNSCSQPQIKDIGIIGEVEVQCEPEACSGCGECAAACEESAVTLDDDRLVGIDCKSCVRCGACARLCPTGALKTGRGNYTVFVGGKLGRHPQLARELARGLDADQVVALVSGIVEVYKANARKGERLGAVVNRLGWGEVQAAVVGNSSSLME
jgi:dissimilatory sulfite reductase (desulfoviridin) alpha/beta subunit